MTAGDLTGSRTASRARAERFARWAFLSCTLVAASVAVAIVAVLAYETLRFFGDVPVARFLTERAWTPLFEDAHFGILPLLVATIQITIGAGVVAIPLGVLTAVYLQQYAHPAVARLLDVGVSLLAGIPTIVYGYFALAFVTPALQRIWPGTEIFNGASASLVVGLMILPTVAALSREALEAVPRSVIDAGVALGVARGRVISRILLPAASAGIMASVVLALARAVGETMIVTIAAGNQARLAWSPLEGIQTLTAFIAQVSLGDAPGGTLEYRTIFAVGAVLFLLTYGMNVVGRTLRARRFGGSRP